MYLATDFEELSLDLNEVLFDSATAAEPDETTYSLFKKMLKLEADLLKKYSRKNSAQTI